MRTLHSRKCRFESLEMRSMLAGNVTVQVTDGDLIITGDRSGNEILIEGTGVSGQYLITPSGDTRINGTPAPFVATGVTDDVTIDLAQGADVLQINNASFPDALSIQLGFGRDRLEMGAYAAYLVNPATVNATSGSVGVNGRFTVDTGEDADRATLVRVFGTANWNVSTGTGNDEFIIYIASSNVLFLNTGSRDDIVNIVYLSSDSSVSIATDDGNDLISILGSAFDAEVVLSGGGGLDTVAVDFCRFNGPSFLLADSGSGDDFILFARSIVDNQVAIFTGDGFDNGVIGRYYADAQGNFATGGNNVFRLDLDTGSEGDSADIRGNVVDLFFGFFGSGNDNVIFGDNVISDFLRLDGFSGFDRLRRFNNFAPRSVIIGFETETFNRVA